MANLLIGLIPKNREGIEDSLPLIATLVESDPKAPFSIATTRKCREGRYTIQWIPSLYPWSLPYYAEL